MEIRTPTEEDIAHARAVLDFIEARRNWATWDAEHQPVGASHIHKGDYVKDRWGSIHHVKGKTVHGNKIVLHTHNHSAGIKDEIELKKHDPILRVHKINLKKKDKNNPWEGVFKMKPGGGHLNPVWA